MIKPLKTVVLVTATVASFSVLSTVLDTKNNAKTCLSSTQNPTMLAFSAL